MIGNSFWTILWKNVFILYWIDSFKSFKQKFYKKNFKWKRFRYLFRVCAFYDKSFYRLCLVYELNITSCKKENTNAFHMYLNHIMTSNICNATCIWLWISSKLLDIFLVVFEYINQRERKKRKKQSNDVLWIKKKRRSNWRLANAFVIYVFQCWKGYTDQSHFFFPKRLLNAHLLFIADNLVCSFFYHETLDIFHRD